MKKTAEGKWNEGHIEKIYEYVNAHLNGYEISHLVDKFVWDKHYLVKTVTLITADYEKEF